MAWYPYSYQTAFNPLTGEKAPAGSVGQVYAVGDTAFETPLETRDLAGLVVSLEVQGDVGYIPTFQVEDHTSVIWKSGDYIFEFTTTMPLPGPAGARVVNAVDNGDGTMSFDLSNGETVGPIPIPEGPVVVDDDVAENINTPTSKTAEALSATYASKEYVGTVAYGTNLEATDATVSNWVPDVETLTGQAIAQAITDGVAPKLDKAEAANTYATLDAQGRQPVRKGELTVNVMDFGAVADGVADDSEAIRSAIIESITHNTETMDENRSVFFPAGTYRITRNNLLSDFDFTAYGLTGSVRQGLKFTGEGKHSSKLLLETAGVEKWLYNNGSISTQKFSHLDFEHLGFHTDDPELGNGFQHWSQGGEKRTRFFACNLNLGTILQTEGAGNADLNRFLLCSITAHKNMLVLNNQQSVVNELISSDVTAYRDMVEIGPEGGGKLHIIGGSYQMLEHATDTADHFFFNAPVDSGNGPGNADFSVTDVSLEMHGANKKLVLTNDAIYPLLLNFTRCNIGTVFGGPRETVLARNSKRVRFDNCILHGDLEFRAQASYAGSPSGALILFRDCATGSTTLPALHARCTADGNSARIIATGCYQESDGTSVQTVYAQDFDHGWQYQTPNGMTAQYKAMVFHLPWLLFPTDTAQSRAVQLPAGAYIRRVFYHKFATAADSAPYQLFIGSDDKSVVLGSSTAATFGDEHIIDLDNVGVLPFSKLRVWAEGTPTTNRIENRMTYIEYV